MGPVRLGIVPTVFLLSPANCGGRRANIVMSERATFDLAVRVRSHAGAPLGEVFSFLSGLYFRGKLAYARAFAAVPEHAGSVAGSGVFVITPNAGLRSPDTLVTLAALRRFADVDVSADNPAYRRPLERSAKALASDIGPDCPVVLLGSIASAKYVDVLQAIFQDRLLFPQEFVGRGDMSRGGLMLRCAAAGEQLTHVTGGWGHPPWGPASTARPGDTRQVRRSVGSSGNAGAPTRILYTGSPRTPARRLRGPMPRAARSQARRARLTTGALMPSSHSAAAAVRDDVELVERILQRDPRAFETLMRRHNTRLFRVARAILRDDAAAEDAVQDGYLDAYRHLAEFRADAQLGTWLVRIVANHALMRLRKQKRDRVVVPFSGVRSGSQERDEMDIPDNQAEPPQSATLRGEVRRILERRIDELPVAFRTVFVMREVEEMSVEETAESLGIPPATVRSRLFRARALLREALARDIDVAAADVFSFAGARCDRIVDAVLSRLRER